MKVAGGLVISGCDTAEILEFTEEALGQIALFVERLAETGLPFAVCFGGDVGDCALAFDQVTEAACVRGFIAKDYGAGLKAVE
jgi:hypothetical protein